MAPFRRGPLTEAYFATYLPSSSALLSHTLRHKGWVIGMMPVTSISTPLFRDVCPSPSFLLHLILACVLSLNQLPHHSFSRLDWGRQKPGTLGWPSHQMTEIRNDNLVFQGVLIQR